jgi:DNA topoisomerase VI subunit B
MKKERTITEILDSFKNHPVKITKDGIKVIRKKKAKKVKSLSDEEINNICSRHAQDLIMAERKCPTEKLRSKRFIG